jgi:outer membrane immunogenic protein
MKKFLLAGISVLALAAGMSSASAADIQRRAVMPAKAPAYITPPYNWTGGYIGINGGGGWGNTSFTAPFPTSSFRNSGGLVGGTLGYNWQMPSNLVVGVEGDLDWSDLRGSAACAGTTCQTRNNWLGTVRGRLGYAFDRVMPYVTGGAAFGDINNTISGVGSSNATKAGWTVGGGLEAAIAGPWTAKIEYLYVDLGRGDAIAGSTSDFHTNLVRAGVNYRF